jgi:hypothetical protein
LIIDVSFVPVKSKFEICVCLKNFLEYYSAHTNNQVNPKNVQIFIKDLNFSNNYQ